jgi:xylose isomerase
LPKACATLTKSSTTLAKAGNHKAKLLWGTANLFSHRRWMSGAATNPDPDVYAYAAATVKANMDATHKLGGRTMCSGAGARAMRRC